MARTEKTTVPAVRRSHREIFDRGTAKMGARPFNNQVFRSHGAHFVCRIGRLLLRLFRMRVFELVVIVLSDDKNGTATSPTPANPVTAVAIVRK